MPPATTTVQGERQHHDEWTLPILQWAARQCKGGESLQLKDILAGPLHIPIDRATKADQMRVARILKLARWTRKRARLANIPTWVWSKEDK
jgi:hypothetical protein